MKKKTILICCALIFLLSNNAYAAWATIDIINMRAFSNQTEHYIVANNFSNPEACPIQNSVVIMRNDTNNWKMVYSVLLTGFITGKPVQVRTAGCNDDGNPIIDASALLKQ